VIGGVHTSYHEQPDKRAIIDLQQRLMLAVIANPLVNVLVHPWWFGGGEFRPGGPMEWFRDMSDIPDDYARELGEAALAHDTAIEANWSALWGNTTIYSPEFLEGYNHYFKTIADTGVKISLSTDAHDIDQLNGIHPMADILDSLGIPKTQLWRPPGSPRPLRSPSL
jgi:histidinol phosphatase-like PHP family hydrolase